MPRRYLYPFGLLALFFAIIVPGSARANMANPYQSGDLVGEPAGELKSVAIERETLTIDARPLAIDAPVAISATYHLRNDGSQTTLDLLFVAPGLAKAGRPQVSLDGQSVPSRIGTGLNLPRSWRPPPTTPALDGSEPLSYQARSNGGILFSVALATGRHEVRVQYGATASAYSRDSPVRYWQLGYILAPARNWASFGQLAVEVDLPPNWSAATQPSLARNGDTLTGQFNGVPSDALALTFQAPVVSASRPDWTVIGFIIGFVAAVATGLLTGRWLGWHRRSGWWALIPAVGIAIGWTLLIGVATAMGTPVRSAPAGQEAWTYGYGRGYEMIGQVLIAAPAGFGVTMLGSLFGRRSIRSGARG